MLELRTDTCAIVDGSGREQRRHVELRGRALDRSRLPPLRPREWLRLYRVPCRQHREDQRNVRRQFLGMAEAAGLERDHPDGVPAPFGVQSTVMWSATPRSRVHKLKLLS